MGYLILPPMTSACAYLHCLKAHLCPICGEELDYWIYFIGGEKSYKSQQFVDPAMHEECARYSMAACPFLRGDIQQYREQTRSMDDPSLVIKRDLQQGRPAKMGLFKTRGYDLDPNGIAIATTWKGEEWF